MASDLLDVLVIEGDENPARDAIRVALSGLDVSLRFANGERAIFEVKAHEPDLLMLDIGAAGSNVTAFVEEVRLTLKRVPWLLLFAPGSGRSAPPAILGLDELHG